MKVGGGEKFSVETLSVVSKNVWETNNVMNLFSNLCACALKKAGEGEAINFHEVEISALLYIFYRESSILVQFTQIYFIDWLFYFDSTS